MTPFPLSKPTSNAMAGEAIPVTGPTAGHTGDMSISYGAHVADDAELRLCGEFAGKHVVELGIASTPNSIAMALAGAKAIAVDPDAQTIVALRAFCRGRRGEGRVPPG